MFSFRKTHTTSDSKNILHTNPINQSPMQMLYVANGKSIASEVLSYLSEADSLTGLFKLRQISKYDRAFVDAFFSEQSDESIVKIINHLPPHQIMGFIKYYRSLPAYKNLMNQVTDTDNVKHDTIILYALCTNDIKQINSAHLDKAIIFYDEQKMLSKHLIASLQITSTLIKLNWLCLAHQEIEKKTGRLLYFKYERSHSHSIGMSAVPDADAAKDVLSKSQMLRDAITYFLQKDKDTDNHVKEKKINIDDFLPEYLVCASTLVNAEALIEKSIENLKKLSSLAYCNISGAHLADMMFFDMNLSFFNCEHVNFRNAEFESLYLTGANLENTNFDSTQIDEFLFDANLKKANNINKCRFLGKNVIKKYQESSIVWKLDHFREIFVQNTSQENDYICTVIANAYVDQIKAELNTKNKDSRDNFTQALTALKHIKSSWIFNYQDQGNHCGTQMQKFVTNHAPETITSLLIKFNVMSQPLLNPGKMIIETFEKELEMKISKSMKQKFD